MLIKCKTCVHKDTCNKKDIAEKHGCDDYEYIIELKYDED